MDFETIIQLVFFLIVVIVSVAGKAMGGEGGDGGQKRPRQSNGDTDASERARKIQEELRRKLAERMQERSGGPPAPHSDGHSQAHPDVRQQPAQSAGRYDPTRPDSQQGMPYQPQQQQKQPQQPARRYDPTRPDSAQGGQRQTIPYPARQQAQEQSAQPAQPALRDYASELEAQRARLQQAREARKAALQETARKNRAAPTAGSGRTRPRKAFEGSVRDEAREALQDPYSARKAFILQELIGRPIALKKESLHQPPV